MNLQLASLSFLLLAMPGKAFVPPTPRAPPFALPSTGPVSSGSPPVMTRSSTSLSMVGRGNIFDRIFRVANANINKLLNGLEDPEKIILQAMDDMQSDLVRVRQAYAEATAGERRLKKQKEQVDAEASDWHQRATLALSRGKEDLAREALARRQTFLERSKMLESQLETQATATSQLYDAMTALDGKIREAMAKKEQLVARARTAKTTQQVNDMISGLTGRTSMDAFVRMEEKVEALEASAQASAEMGLIKYSDSVETEFKFLEQSSEVEDELQKLKQGMDILNGPKRLGAGPNATMKTASKERVNIPIQTSDKFDELSW